MMRIEKQLIRNGELEEYNCEVESLLDRGVVKLLKHEDIFELNKRGV